tara:strand:+ start:2442 stop:3029 length:588 start_codon:yes stop_codon:yes gene_type:complete
MQKFESKKLEISDCYIDQLSSYLDQELPKPEMKMVEAHLENCYDCRLELIQLRQVDNVLRGEESILPSSEFLTNVRTQIKKRQRKSRKFWFDRFVSAVNYFLPCFSSNRKIIRLSIVSLSIVIGIILHSQLLTLPTSLSENQLNKSHKITEYFEFTNLVLADSNDRQLQQLPHPMSSEFQWKYNSLTKTNQYSQP